MKLPKHDPLDVPATREQINQWRAEQERKPITVFGYTFDADPDSIARLGLAIRAHFWAIDTPLRWQLANNETVDLDSEVSRRVWDALERELYLRQGGLHVLTQEFKRAGVTVRELKEWKP